MNLLVRTDASVAMGTGHAMRCLALAQAWQDAGGHVTYAMAETTPAIQARLALECCPVIPVSAAAGTATDVSQTIECARKAGAEWIAADGYQFRADYQHALKAEGFKLLFLDDYGHGEHYCSDFVLNQNVCASQSLYADRESQTQLLLGPRYSLLRREFAAWRSWKRTISSACRHLLLLMGGSDPQNLTARLIDAVSLAKVEDLEVTVLAGGSNPHFSALEDMAARSGRRITLRIDISDMASLMATADVAISAAGSTCWELCLMGLPALLLDVAGNQTALARELHRRGCAIHLGDQRVSSERIAAELRKVLDSREVRQSLSQRSRELVDGNGAKRVVSVLCGNRGIWLRRARAEDSTLLWEWANDAEVRAASFSSDPIPRSTHADWFAGKLSGNQSLIWIAEDEESVPFGQVRFDARQSDDWEVDVSIAAARRGRGLASKLIQLAVANMREENHAARIHAFVKPSNVASSSAFERACFKRVATEEIRGHVAIHFVHSEPALL